MKLDRSFFTWDVLEVAPGLLGKVFFRKFPEGNINQYIITEVEAYRGEEDIACHASKGKTPRTSVMYEQGGLVYVYLIYGMYWMLNVVTSAKDNPQAVLIRGLQNFDGPGRVENELAIDKTFYREDVCKSKRLWIEDQGIVAEYITKPRVGIDYAGDFWKNKAWRFILTSLSAEPGKKDA